jgi:hypothetical protein
LQVSIRAGAKPVELISHAIGRHAEQALPLHSVEQRWPVCLEVAAQLAFPDNSMSASALRRLIVKGKLEAEFIAGKYFTTLSAIERIEKHAA